jgi:hypothetical protein
MLPEECRTCRFRITVTVCKTFEQEEKQEQYHVCALSYCPYGKAEDKFDVYLDSIGL